MQIRGRSPFQSINQERKRRSKMGWNGGMKMSFSGNHELAVRNDLRWFVRSWCDDFTKRDFRLSWFVIFKWRCYLPMTGIHTHTHADGRRGGWLGFPFFFKFYFVYSLIYLFPCCCFGLLFLFDCWEKKKRKTAIWNRYMEKQNVETFQVLFPII
jgi:hypothetical protein